MPERLAILDCAGNECYVLPSGLTVLVRPMPDYAAAHAIVAARFGSIDVHFRLGEEELTLPAGAAHYLEHKMFEDQEGDAFAKFARTGANANAFTSFDRTWTRRGTPLPNLPAPGPTPTPSPALTAPAITSPPPAQWTRIWIFCWG